MVNQVHQINNSSPAVSSKNFHCSRLAADVRLAQSVFPGMLLLWVSTLLVAIQSQILGEAF